MQLFGDEKRRRIKNKLMNKISEELKKVLDQDQVKKEEVFTAQRTQELFQDFENHHNQEAQRFKQKLEKANEQQKEANTLIYEALQKQEASLQGQNEIIADYHGFISRVIREGGQMERYYKELLARAYAHLRLTEEKVKKQEKQMQKTKKNF